MKYEVRLEQFEGPLELLLNLIEKEKLDVTRVSLSRVTDQYLEHIEKREDISLLHLAEFLSIATRLLLLKSRALLPLLVFSPDEEAAIDDLESRLREYQRFKDAGKALGILLEQRKHSYVRESFAGRRSVFYPPEGLGVDELRRAFENVLGEISLPEKLEEETLREIITLEEKIVHLQGILTEKIETTFEQLAGGARDKVELIVSFLALLELVKQRFVRADQKDFFGQIHIRRS